MTAPHTEDSRTRESESLPQWRQDLIELYERRQWGFGTLEEVTDLIQSALRAELQEVERERERYRGFLIEFLNAAFASEFKELSDRARAALKGEREDA